MESQSEASEIIMAQSSLKPDHAAVLNAPLQLPCGVTLPNRLVKGAMSEILADSRNRATEKHATLYRAFAKNGPGMLLTGNVQVDRFHLEHGGNVRRPGAEDPAQRRPRLAWGRAHKAPGQQK